jgi:hypothetical protein
MFYLRQLGKNSNGNIDSQCQACEDPWLIVNQ